MATASVSGKFNVSEGKSTSYTLSFDNITNSSFSYQHWFTNGTATSADFSGGTGSGSISIVSSQPTSRSTEISFSAAEDLVFDPSETVYLVVSLTGISFSDSSTYRTFEITIKDVEPPKIVFRGAGNGEEIVANAEDNTVKGFGGADVIFGRAGADLIYGGKGADKLHGENGFDTLYGGDGLDNLNGGNGEDRLFGGNGSDKLNGGASKDKLVGGNGKDILIGGAGADTLTGGKSADTFVFNKLSGKDKITDFGGSDIIRINSGANSMKDLQFADTKAGLLIEFGSVDIFLKGLDREDMSKSDFDFG